MIKILYKKLLKPFLFLFDPELVHDAFVNLGAFMGKTAIGRRLIGWLYAHNGSDASVTIDGLRYKQPVLLAAGFDYNGRLPQILPYMAFGGEEVGSVTARPCGGNPKTRLTRLIKSGSLLVNKGLKNEGVDNIIERVKVMRYPEGFVLGISIAKTNDEQACTLEHGIEDYVYSLKKLVAANIGDFYTINISCPNAFGGENFADPHRLDLLLQELNRIEHTRPVYVKMPINLPWMEFDALLEVIVKHKMHGVVIGNLNKKYADLKFRDEAPAEYRGGLSGAPCRALSTELIRQTKSKYGNTLTIIGCGGILSAKDALEKFDAGADLLQLITGMIFEGPHLMSEIAEAYAQHGPFTANRTTKTEPVLQE
jgi:dihydroorotate dehydrogenase